MAKLIMAQSVGMGGVNTPNDVKAVQGALNNLLRLIPPTRKLVEDGRLGSRPEHSKTVAAIKIFQSKSVGMVRPDGKIDANGRSHRKFNEKLSAHLAASVVPISGSLKVILKKNLEKYEGRVPHMYLDSVGQVTVGIGHMMTDVQAAQKVPFVVSSSRVPATAQQIEDEFNLIKAQWVRVQGAQKLPNAAYYKKFTKLELLNTDIDVIRDSHIVNFEKELKGLYGYSTFSTYPDDVKLALFDMIFNLGLTRLSNKFVNFNIHIKASDFKKAALESNRHQLSTDRNFYVRNLLSNAK
ncbi:hypothetical protein [Shewanella sp. S1-58-MNA-CIBAN-0166]|uniref:hypothetical protein n=1 Tax=Shewanella sp. S1-58-MNA-CIBAN-0166 TaxID=3140467 RepID=UPI0033264279